MNTDTEVRPAPDAPTALIPRELLHKRSQVAPTRALVAVPPAWETVAGVVARPEFPPASAPRPARPVHPEDSIRSSAGGPWELFCLVFNFVALPTLAIAVIWVVMASASNAPTVHFVQPKPKATQSQAPARAHTPRVKAASSATRPTVAAATHSQRPTVEDRPVARETESPTVSAPASGGVALKRVTKVPVSRETNTPEPVASSSPPVDPVPTVSQDPCPEGQVWSPVAGSCIEAPATDPPPSS